MAKSDIKTGKVIALLKKNQGLDKFEIAGKLKYKISDTQAVLRRLQEKRTVVSGLEKMEGSSRYDRRYYLLL